MEIKVNVGFRNLHRWRDSLRRTEHMVNRMALRGIGLKEIKEAIEKGAKKLREDQSLIAEYRWYKVIYREYRLENLRKIYPITVIRL